MDEQNTLILAALAIGGLYMMTKKEEDDVEFIKEVKSEEISRVSNPGARSADTVPSALSGAAIEVRI